MMIVDHHSSNGDRPFSPRGGTNMKALNLAIEQGQKWWRKKKRRMARRTSKLKGKVSRIGVSRIGTYAIASSITDQCVTCTTFNILAPIYKRLSSKVCNALFLLHLRIYFICSTFFSMNPNLVLLSMNFLHPAQEFWVGNEELVNMYEKRLGNAGYITFKLARTNNRGDGLLTALHKDHFKVINHKDLLLNDIGDRVAQLLHVELLSPLFQTRSNNVRQEILIVNTHLLFPHDSSLSLVRLHQVYEILQNVEAYQKEHKLNPLPIILCGDWNGSKRGHVYKFLRSQGFVSSYDTAHQYTDADAHKWISHRNHLGNICGVDFIWLLNPNRYRKLLKTSWNEAVFGMFKSLLRKASLTESDAFAFLKADNDSDYITYSAFCGALRRLQLAGRPYGLSEAEMEDLWVQADIDGNGVVDYNEFQQRIWNLTRSEESEHGGENSSNEIRNTVQTIGFSVKNAVLFPTEVEKGKWPEYYSLSDHARLTVVFSPVRMPCSQLINE
ncbi:hypothetical protein Cgig2_023291 [Carnegiea gigantea]|uniref:EF-hand domain-containing protein n=1 Tax=Carnegiea gigantea TaxID=171969 RepID=A0A9Q1GWK6_9CARY|nr:hypothetical protein Cgig2_023291 [Carnegiea gigantea]